MPRLTKTLRSFLSSNDDKEQRVRAFERQSALRRCYHNRLRQEHDTYKQVLKLKISVMTYNVGEKAPVKGYSEIFGEDPDIISIALQEVDMSSSAMATENTNKGELWCSSMMQEVNKIGSYYRVFGTQLVGLVLLVFVKKEHKEHVRHVRKAIVRLGAMNRSFGNKGAIGVRMSLYGKRVCFIAAHFEAHKEYFEKRNQNYYYISRDLKFKLPPDADDEVDTCITKSMLEGRWSGFAVQSPPSSFYSSRDLYSSFDYIFWFGDLNYRIWQVKDHIIYHALDDNNFQSLWQYDQLTQAKNEGLVFPGWGEGVLNFRPTYKYDIGTDTYDTSEKLRTPSWTDRILYYPGNSSNDWSSVNTNCLQQITYGRFEYRESDHRPVASQFIAKFIIVDPEKFEKCLIRVWEEIQDIPLELMKEPGNRSPPHASDDESSSQIPMESFRYSLESTDPESGANLEQVLQTLNRIVPSYEISNILSLTPFDPICLPISSAPSTEVVNNLSFSFIEGERGGRVRDSYRLSVPFSLPPTVTRRGSDDSKEEPCLGESLSTVNQYDPESPLMNDYSFRSSGTVSGTSSRRTVQALVKEADRLTKFFAKMSEELINLKQDQAEHILTSPILPITPLDIREDPYPHEYIKLPYKELEIMELKSRIYELEETVRNLRKENIQQFTNKVDNKDDNNKNSQVEMLGVIIQRQSNRIAELENQLKLSNANNNNNIVNL